MAMLFENFQNNMVHHPLLQYQMLFPSIFMLLGALPSQVDEGVMFDEDILGKVNPIDYLRYSAMANQLAIIQINQVLMDLVAETPCTDFKQLTDLHKDFKESFIQVNKDINENKDILAKNSNMLQGQGLNITKVTDIIAKSISKTVALQTSIDMISSRAVSNAEEVQDKLHSMADNLTNIHDAVNILTNHSLNLQEQLEKECNANETESFNSTQAILDILSDLQNLKVSLKNITEEGKLALDNRGPIETLIERCTNASIEDMKIDMDKITQNIEEGFVNNLREIQPQVNNLTEGLERFNSTMIQTQEDLKDLHQSLKANMSKNEADLQVLRELTERGFADLHNKIEDLHNTSLLAEANKAPSFTCPGEFFPVGEECFFLALDPILTYEEAKEECKKKDAHLAEPQELMKFLVALNDQYDKGYGLEVWLGGSGKKEPAKNCHESGCSQDLEWTWNTSSETIQTGWNIHFPQVVSVYDSCILVQGSGLEHADCESEKGFVCEIIQ